MGPTSITSVLFSLSFFVFESDGEVEEEAVVPVDVLAQQVGGPEVVLLEPPRRPGMAEAPLSD